MSRAKEYSLQGRFKKKPLYYVLFSILAATSHASEALPPGADLLDKHNNLFIFRTDSPYRPRATLNAEVGWRSSGQLDYLVPVLARDDVLLFVDGRFREGTRNYREYNIGLGGRYLFRNKIFGVHTWADWARTEERHYFKRATVGLEYLSDSYDVRANAYLPYGRNTQYLTPKFNPFIFGHTVGFVRNDRIRKEAIGGDIQVGRQVPWIPNLKAFADYYHFEAGHRKMDGGRGRLEYYYNYNVTLTAAYAYDNIKHSTGYVGVRLSLGGVTHPNCEPMQKRMEDFIIRDPEALAITRRKSTQVISTIPYWFVNNAAPPGGDGSFEHPFNTEIQAEDAASSGNVIYTFQGIAPYPLPTGGLNLKTTQLFTASGGALTFNNVVILPAGTPPVLSGRINVADGDIVTNFILSGSNSNDSVGIFGNGSSNVMLLNLTIQDFAGASLNGANATLSKDFLQPATAGMVGGSAFGIQMENSTNTVLSNIAVNNIVGGDANGGSTTIQTINSTMTVESGRGGTGGSVTGIDLLGSKGSTLTNVIVSGINGGLANGGDVTIGTIDSSTQISAICEAGAGSVGGAATGINLLGSSSPKLNNVSVSFVSSGNANGGQATIGAISNLSFAGISNTGGVGGTGNASTGITLQDTAAATLTSITVSNITEGCINGGAATLGPITNFHLAGFSNTSGGGGMGASATGIDLSDASGMFNTISVSSITGGSANNGDISVGAISRSSVFAGSNTSGNSGNGGASRGIEMSGSSSLLNGINVYAITGGAANGAASRIGAISDSNNFSVTNTAGPGNRSGAATGINATGSSSSLNGIAISVVTSGSANGGATEIGAVSTSSNYLATNTGGNGGLAESSIGIDLTAARTVLANASVSHVFGGNAMGGDAVGFGTNTGGNGGSGGNAIGIIKGMASPTQVTITDIEGGSAKGGIAQGGANTNGVDGSDGISSEQSFSLKMLKDDFN